RSRSCRLLPEPACFAKPMTFIVIVVVQRVVLYRALAKERFGQSVPVFHSPHSEPRRIEHIHSGNTHLCQMSCAAETQRIGLLKERSHDRRIEDWISSREHLESVGAL